MSDPTVQGQKENERSDKAELATDAALVATETTIDLAGEGFGSQAKEIAEGSDVDGLVESATDVAADGADGIVDGILDAGGDAVEAGLEILGDIFSGF